MIWNNPYKKRPADLRKAKGPPAKQNDPMPFPPRSKKIIVFDGVCGLCNRGVDLILRWDKKGQFTFAPLQGPFAQTLYQSHPSLKQVDTIIYLNEEALWIKSEAVLRILKDLGGLWSGFYFFKLIPQVFRDKLYDVIAKHRYRLFGKRDCCRIPQAKEQSQFIE